MWKALMSIITHHKIMKVLWLSTWMQQAGMLGQNLKEGEPCPVCGSTSHPHITEVKDEIPSEKDLKNAKNLRQKKEEKRSEISGI